MIRRLFGSFYNLYLLYRFKRRWRKRNAHNFTTARNIFPVGIVSVGQYTYGEINIRYYLHPDEKLVIGNFVSIADNVTFILGGNHRMDCFTNYPLYSKLFRYNSGYDALTKGVIMVEDEVWIGSGVTILSGVKIGKGAIIAAGSVVTGNIPAYSMAGGNPARIIKYRFDNKCINEIGDIYLADIPRKFLTDNIENFYKPLDIDSVFFMELKKFRRNTPAT